MQNKFYNRKIDEKGFSLLEVVASLVLLSIILLSFSYLIVNSLKTAKTSESIIDYTYYAQTEIEKIYALHTNHTTTNLDAKKELLKTTLNYSEKPEVDGYTILQRSDGSTIYYRIEMKSHDVYPDLTTLIVEVFDKDPDTSRSPKAHMETILSGGS